MKDKDCIEEIKKEKELLLLKYIEASFKSWRLSHELCVGKEEAEKCYEYLINFYNSVYPISDKQLNELNISDFYKEENKSIVEQIAKQYGIPYSISFAEALKRFLLHITHSKNGVYDRIKLTIKEPVENFISWSDKGGLEWWVLEAYEKEGFEVFRPYKNL